MCDYLCTKEAVGLVCVALGILWWKWNKGSEKRSPVDLGELNDSVLVKSCTELAEMIRKGDTTSEKVTRAFIKQIEKVNKDLNAVVANRFTAAIKEAIAADAAPSDKRKPFHGVPLIIKECFEYPGMPYTSGLVRRKGTIGENKNPAVQRMEDNGFIVLGSGNLSEACMWMESANNVYGRTCNPYDTTRNPGGSSGGCASIVSACGGPAAITSDVGGSTRIPASFNGLFGHKPTGGAVPNTHTIPAVHGIVERYCQLGPTTRHAEDLWPILNIISGPDGVANEYCTTKASERWKDPKDVRVKSLKVRSMRKIMSGSKLVTARCAEHIKAQERVENALREMGCDVEVIDVDYMGKAFDIWAAMLGDAQPQTFDVVLSEKKEKINSFVELLKLPFGTSEHTFAGLGLALIDGLMPKSMVKKLCGEGEVLRERLEADIGENGIWVAPSLPTCAPKHGFWNNWFVNSTATSIFNVMEMPATHIPCGLHPETHLPVGVQLVAQRGNDHLTIAAAMELSRQNVAKWCPPVPAL